MPLSLALPPKVMNSSKRRPGERRPYVPKSGREKTPPALADWLVELARRTRPPGL